MNRAFASFASALGYFTVLPVARWMRVAPLDAGALLVLPLIGASIGALSGWFGSIVAARVPLLGAVLAVAACVVLSGAIHLDGFLDCADGLFAQVPAERRREIMRDPRHGTFAFVAGAFALLVWIACVLALRPSVWPLILGWTGLVGRTAALLCTALFAQDVSGSHARTLTDASTRWVASGYAIVAVAIAASIGTSYVVRVACAFACAFGIALWAQRQLGGKLNGDCLGAIAVASEIVALL